MGQKPGNKSSANHLNNEKIKPEPVKKHSQTNSKMQNLKRQLHKENFSLDGEIDVPNAQKKDNAKMSSVKFGNGGDFKISLTAINPDEECNNKRKEIRKSKTQNTYKIQNNETPNTVRDINQFTFIKVIGKGTFGKVILAKNKEDGEFYALKCVKKDYITKTKNVENLKNEKKLLEQVNSPFIIKLHFTFQNKEKIFFAFSYCNGGELFFHLTKCRRFKEEYVRIYAAEIYWALRYLHSKNIIYRDLKPENIILDKDGHIKIIDFGLAKGKITKTNLTASVCGTNEYIPPEVINGAKYNYNFDWWGFGIIIYELLFGHPPFVDQSKSHLFKKIKDSEPNYDKVKISKEGKELMQQLLKKDLKQRIKPEEIPFHPWFKGIDFEEVRNLKIKAPFIPKIKNEDDLSNIDPVFLNENIYSPMKKRVFDIDQKNFIDF